MLVLLPASAALFPTAAQPLGRRLLDAALNSPLYRAVLVPQAKRTMVSTAEQNGVPWSDALEWIQSQGPWSLPDGEAVSAPEYYRQPFHAYEMGNLCWEAALEGEIASRAVGARNFPAAGADGELAFRGAFDEALASMGATVPDGGRVVDLGCGSGISTRRIAAAWPQAESVVGIDLSPHFIAVGQRLQELGCAQAAAGHGAAATWRWVNPAEEYADPRVSLTLGDAATTRLPDGSADVVSLSLVIHELPPSATVDVCAEALRLLKPGGQLWVTEMDFETEGFTKLRANPLLFSLIRSTEPYLDVYADWMPQLPSALAEIGFGPVRLAAATGRHFALVATKPAPGQAGMAPGEIDDRRQQTAKEDTHLKTWEAKKGGS